MGIPLSASQQGAEIALLAGARVSACSSRGRTPPSGDGYMAVCWRKVNGRVIKAPISRRGQKASSACQQSVGTA